LRKEKLESSTATTRDKICSLAGPLASERGLEVLDVDFSGEAGSRTVRIYLDSAEENGGVAIEDCAAVSRALSDLLDVNDDVIRGHFMLEVSSPGLNRPLRLPSHFRRVVGERVRITLTVQGDGRRRVKGSLERADDKVIVVVEDKGSRREISYKDITRANLEYCFDQAGATEA